MSEEIIDRCKCTLRESLLGDGCKMCKPYLHIANLESTLKDAECEITDLELRIDQLEAELADARKDQERYRFVRDMTPEQFENTSTIHEDFNRQIDAMIKEQGK